MVRYDQETATLNKDMTEMIGDCGGKFKKKKTQLFIYLCLYRSDLKSMIFIKGFC